MKATPLGSLPDGSRVDGYVLTNGRLELRAITFGAIITALRVPDRRGRVADVTLGYAELDPYLNDPAYLGAAIGRYANRIAFGRFVLDGTTYQLECNDGPHHLHGGRCGFNRRLWSGRAFQLRDAVGVTFTRTSAAGEEGYPGNLDLAVTYLLTRDSVVVLYAAVTDAPTPVNLTQHSYFNLTGMDGADVLDHELMLHAPRFTPVDHSLIPTGDIASVDGTPFDFRSRVSLRRRLKHPHEQLERAAGFDHNFIIDRDGPGLVAAAELRDPGSGRVIDVATTAPGVQLYIGQQLGAGTAAAQGPVFRAHAGLCLETQLFPDSPNRPSFPCAILRPGRTWRSKTVWRFRCE